MSRRAFWGRLAVGLTDDLKFRVLWRRIGGGRDTVVALVEAPKKIKKLTISRKLRSLFAFGHRDFAFLRRVIWKENVEAREM